MAHVVSVPTKENLALDLVVQPSWHAMSSFKWTFPIRGACDFFDLAR